MKGLYEQNYYKDHSSYHRCCVTGTGGCTGSIPEGQSFREYKAVTTEIDGCKIRKFYIRTSASNHGEPVFMARCSDEEVTTMTKRDSGKNAEPARVLIIRENGVDKLFEEKK